METFKGNQSIIRDQSSRDEGTLVMRYQPCNIGLSLLMMHLATTLYTTYAQLLSFFSSPHKMLHTVDRVKGVLNRLRNNSCCRKAGMDEDDIGVAFLLKFSKTKLTILIHKNGKQRAQGPRLSPTESRLLRVMGARRRGSRAWTLSTSRAEAMVI
jgi:hypothetical protein